MTPLDLTKKDVTVENSYNESDYIDVYKKYRDPATQYCRDVLNCDIISSYTIKLACLRHIRDLQRSLDNDPDFQYHYDLNHVKMILGFASVCPDVNTGAPVPLMAWQKCTLSLSVGWRRNSDGGKRFKRALLSVSRTNGKTYLVNIMLMYSYLVESGNKTNQEYAYIAPVSQQVNKGFDYVIQTSNRLAENPIFKSKFEKELILVQEQAVRSKKTRNKIVKMSNESGQFDSFHFTYAIFDEAGDPRNDGANLGKITSGQVQDANGQFIMISTAYHDVDVPFRQQERAQIESMEKDHERDNDDYLCLIWQQDSLDEVNHPELWEKSNPILGLESIKESMLANLVSERNTKQQDGSLDDFITRNMNMWQSREADKFIPSEYIEQAVSDADFDITGRDVFIGLDYSIKDDLTSISCIFPYLDGDIEKYYIFEHSFIPLAGVNGDIWRKERADKIAYRKMETLGYCSISKNGYGTIDSDEVIHWLLDFVETNQLKVQAFVYDPYMVSSIIRHLDTNTDWAMMALPQKTGHLSEPTKSLRQMFAEQRVTIPRNEVLIESLRHAELSTENNGVRIDKRRRSLKIDSVMATIDAYAEAMFYFENFNRTEGKSNDIWKGIDPNQYFKTQFSF